MSHFGSGNDPPEEKHMIQSGKKGSTYPPMQIQAIRRMESNIMQVTAAYGSTGISHTRLADLVGIDRKNLSAYTKRLTVRGMLRRGPGKQGKYYLATQNKIGPVVTPDIFGKTAGELLAKEVFDLKSPFIASIGTRDLPEYQFFSFSNRVGVVMTYLLIQSLGESNRIVTEPKNNAGIGLNNETWMYDAVSSLVPILLPMFKEVAMSIVPGLNIPICDILDGHCALPEGIVYELLESLCNSYPSIRPRLERIKSQLPREVDRRIAQWEYAAECSKQQKICKHKFKQPSNQALVVRIRNGILRMNNNINRRHEILHCHKCHLTKYENCTMCYVLMACFGF